MERAGPPGHDETGRLAALRRYAILDTPPEEAFDGLVRLASRVCDTPIALITLIDEARQWFKARVGLDLLETSREVAFCRHAITGRGMCLITDALVDERFRANPLVTGDPHIRFYAGVPLVTPDGFSLGTLCVIDRVPRELAPFQIEALELLARETMTQLELRRVARELAQTQATLEAANADLQSFGAAAAHDLRAPLRSIHGYAEVLLDDFAEQLPPQAREHLMRIRASCGVMNEVIAALLRLSQVSNAELLQVPLDLTALAREVAQSLASREPTRSVRFNAAETAPVRADPGLMRILIENLLSNAWKFTRLRADPQVEFGVQDRGGGREYFVRDNGAGFEAGENALLRPFRRQHKDPAFEGVGLGLTIAQRIVQRHGGTLRIESARDQGTTVSFILPSDHRLNS